MPISVVNVFEVIDIQNHQGKDPFHHLRLLDLDDDLFLESAAIEKVGQWIGQRLRPDQVMQLRVLNHNRRLIGKQHHLAQILFRELIWNQGSQGHHADDTVAKDERRPNNRARPVLRIISKKWVSGHIRDGNKFARTRHRVGQAIFSRLRPNFLHGAIAELRRAKFQVVVVIEKDVRVVGLGQQIHSFRQHSMQRFFQIQVRSQFLTGL